MSKRKQRRNSTGSKAKQYPRRQTNWHLLLKHPSLKKQYFRMRGFK